jgi:monoamine oxidase
MSRQKRVTRRNFLTALAAIGGTMAAYDGAVLLGLVPPRSAHAAMPGYDPGLGQNRRVIVIGAGVAGLTAGWHLARSGFDVTILEATDRIAGRTLTLRNGDTVAETNGPTQICNLVQNTYFDGRPVATPSYINAGAGRIGQHSAMVLDYCREFGVELEPYIFTGESNLLQSDTAFGGQPMPFRRVRNGIRTGLADVLRRMVENGRMDGPLAGIDVEEFLEILDSFAGYDAAGYAARLHEGPLPDGYFFSPRSGYSVDPGAGANPGIPYPDLPFDELVNSRYWDFGLYSGMSYHWQGTMVQPVGGMDMICRRMVVRPLPDGRTLEDLIRLRSPVTGFWNREDGVEVLTAAGEMLHAEFCVCTAAAPQVAGLTGNLSQALKTACTEVKFIPSTKVAGQMNGRFWEELPDSTERIFGGISWTDAVSWQIWYPSSEFHSRYGVLTMAYNFSEDAETLGNMSIDQRVETCLVQGEKFHPGLFRKHFLPKSGISVAWHRMPYQYGVSADDPAYSDPALYEALTDLSPEGRFWMAGDRMGYLTGWMDAAFATAEVAVKGIAERARSE